MNSLYLLIDQHSEFGLIVSLGLFKGTLSKFVTSRANLGY